jgi:hypothetical protein
MWKALINLKSALMNRMRRTLLRILPLVLILQAVAKDQNWQPPKHVDSPDRRFSIDMEPAKPGQASGGNDEFLVIREGGKEIARQATLGFLLDVFWDDTGKYVAINNRQANAGDYLWVFSLPDGKCIKPPDSPQLKPLSKLALDAFQHLDSRATDQKLEKVWVTGKGWWGNGKLLVRFAARYGYTVGKFPAHFVYDAPAKISSSGLEFIPGEARAVQYLGD